VTLYIAVVVLIVVVVVVVVVVVIVVVNRQIGNYLPSATREREPRERGRILLGRVQLKIVARERYQDDSPNAMILACDAIAAHYNAP